MQNRNSPVFSPAQLSLNLVGTVLMGLGLAKYLADVDVISRRRCASRTTARS